MIVRQAKADDAAALAAIHADASRAAYDGIFPQKMLDEFHANAIERWSNRLVDPFECEHTLVSELGGELTGFVRYGPCRDPDSNPDFNAEIWALYVSPACWRRGCGFALWQAVLTRILKLRYTDVSVWTLQANPRARAFYECAGFALQPDRTKNIERGGQEFPEVRYWQAIRHD